MKPNFDNDDENDDNIQNMIMSNNQISGMFKSVDEQRQFAEFFKKMQSNGKNSDLTNNKVKPII